MQKVILPHGENTEASLCLCCVTGPENLENIIGKRFYKKKNNNSTSHSNQINKKSNSAIQLDRDHVPNYHPLTNSFLICFCGNNLVLSSR